MNEISHVDISVKPQIFQSLQNLGYDNIVIIDVILIFLVLISIVLQACYFSCPHAIV